MRQLVQNYNTKLESNRVEMSALALVAIKYRSTKQVFGKFKRLKDGKCQERAGVSC